MNHGGDAAEQMMRMSLEGVEIAARISGAAVKELALFLYLAIKSAEKGDGKTKTRGKARLDAMLKSGKPLEIFTLRDEELKRFAKGAKEYGIVYCVLRGVKNCPDGLCDVMVKADDAPKISRLVERLGIATVVRGEPDSDVHRPDDWRPQEPYTPDGYRPWTEPDGGLNFDLFPQTPDDIMPDTGTENRYASDTDRLIDEFLGIPDSTDGWMGDPVLANADMADWFNPKAERPKPESAKSDASRADTQKPAPSKTEPPNAAKGEPDSRPFPTGAPQPRQSEPTYGDRKKPEKRTSSKKSVKQEMREIEAARKAKEKETPKRDDREKSKGREKPAPTTTTHRQPERGKRKPKRENTK